MCPRVRTTSLEYVMVRRLMLALLAAVAVSPMVAQSAPQPAQSKGSAAEETPAWEAPLEARIQELIDRNGPGTDAPLREQLLKMVAVDQSARQVATSSGAPVKESMQKLAATDAELTSELKQIVEQKGWRLLRWSGSMHRLPR